MNNIGIISDIHGNIDAFKKVLEYFENNQITDIYFLGDAVGYLPYGIEVLELLQERNIKCIRGNHENMLFQNEISKNEAIYKLEIIKRNISINLLDFIKSWKNKMIKNICLCMAVQKA
jgi:predicted phosphodiesterase